MFADIFWRVNVKIQELGFTISDIEYSSSREVGKLMAVSPKFSYIVVGFNWEGLLLGGAYTGVTYYTAIQEYNSRIE